MPTTVKVHSGSKVSKHQRKLLKSVLQYDTHKYYPQIVTRYTAFFSILLYDNVEYKRQILSVNETLEGPCFSWMTAKWLLSLCKNIWESTYESTYTKKITDSLVLWGRRGVQALAKGALYLGCQWVHGENRGQCSVPLHCAVGEALIPQVLDVLSGLAEHVLTLWVLVLQVLKLQTGEDITVKLQR